MTTEHETVRNIAARTWHVTGADSRDRDLLRGIEKDLLELADRIERAHARESAMREAIRRMAHALESGEWAEHALDSDDDVSRLEAQITRLVGAHAAGAGRVPEMQALYAAASKGFHTTLSSGLASRYEHISRFRSIDDLEDYGLAFSTAMRALSAAPAPSTNPAAVPVGKSFRRWVRSVGGDVMERDGRYVSSMTRLWWQCWQAATAAAAAPAPWRPMSSHPESKPGEWSRPVIAVSNGGHAFRVSCMGGYWQRPAAFVALGHGEKLVAWTDFPDVDQVVAAPDPKPEPEADARAVSAYSPEGLAHDAWWDRSLVGLRAEVKRLRLHKPHGQEWVPLVQADIEHLLRAVEPAPQPAPSDAPASPQSQKCANCPYLGALPCPLCPNHKDASPQAAQGDAVEFSANQIARFAIDCGGVYLNREQRFEMGPLQLLQFARRLVGTRPATAKPAPVPTLSDADIDAWLRRHNLESAIRGTDARAAFEDAQTAHLLPESTRLTGGSDD